MGQSTYEYRFNSTSPFRSKFCVEQIRLFLYFRQTVKLLTALTFRTKLLNLAYAGQQHLSQRAQGLKLQVVPHLSMPNNVQHQRTIRTPRNTPPQKKR
eukprot:3296361-Amphidinium_carterae.1